MMPTVTTVMIPSVSMEPPSHRATSGWILPWRGRRYQKLTQPNAIQAKPMTFCNAEMGMACSTGLGKPPRQTEWRRLEVAIPRESSR